MLQLASLLLRALLNPETVKMTVRTAGGFTTTVPCKVSKVGGKVQIKADYFSTGSPIVDGVITIGGRTFARSRFHRGGMMLCQSGPMELGGEF
jgi:hypothetical protein